MDTRTWIYQLQKEYDYLVYAYRLSLRRPVIAVENLKGRWGQWDGETRTLILSRSLIENHAWEIVQEVLKHELAHQVVSENYGCDEAHGPLFYQVCEQLGVAAWARRSESEMPPPPSSEGPVDEAQARLLQRVEKLLSLAQSQNENEAGSAMRKVQELYRKYNIDQLACQAPREWIYRVLKTKRRRLERYQYSICSLLKDHFFVEVVHASQFNSLALVSFKVVELLGTRENVLMAEYVYSFLSQQLELLWAGHRQAVCVPGRARQSFYLGVLAGFRKKLDSQAETLLESLDLDSLALVNRGGEDLRRYVRSRHPKLVNVPTGGRQHFAESYSAGKSQGEQLILRKPVSSKKSGIRALLSGK